MDNLLMNSYKIAVYSVIYSSAALSAHKSNPWHQLRFRKPFVPDTILQLLCRLLYKLLAHVG
jgi:hypothetical protein